MSWKLWPSDDGAYGEPEPDYHEVQDPVDNTVAIMNDRDHPRSDNGDNFFWKILIFPFRVLGAGKQPQIERSIDGYNPVLGAVSAKEIDDKFAGDPEKARQHYDRKRRGR